MKGIVVLFLGVSCYLFTACDKHHDIKNGRVERFYPNGARRVSASYVNDTLHGMYIEYFECGNIKSVINYEKGEQHGNYILLDLTGSLAEVGQKKNNQRVGIQLIYKNGILTKSHQYVNVAGQEIQNHTYNWDVSGNNLNNHDYFCFLGFFGSSDSPIKDDSPTSEVSLVFFPQRYEAGDDATSQMTFVVGDYDDQFSLPANSIPDTLRHQHLGGFVIDFHSRKLRQNPIRCKFINRYKKNDEFRSDTIYIVKDLIEGY